MPTPSLNASSQIQQIHGATVQCFGLKAFALHHQLVGLSITASPGLAVNGTVRLGFAGKTDDSPQAAAELLQNEALGRGRSLVVELCLFDLLQQTVTRRLGHFLRDKCVR